MLAIEVLRVSLRHTLHELRRSVLIIRSGEQVDVIRHEDIRMDAAVKPGRQLLEQAEIQLAIRPVHEAWPTVHPAVPDVEGNAGDDDAGMSGHADINAVAAERNTGCGRPK